MTGDKKELIKTYWLAGTAKSTRTRRMSTNRNPEIQVTNIEFTEPEESKPSPEKKKESPHRRPHMSYTSHGKRTSKINNNSSWHHDENYIEPW